MTPEKSGEFHGKTVEAAINAGLAALGLRRDQVEVEIVRPGSRGVLGIGAEDAIVRLKSIRLPTAPPPPPAEPVPAPRPTTSGGAVASAEPKAVPRPQPKAEPKQEPAKAPRGGATTKMDAKTLAAARQGQEFLAGLLALMDIQAQVEIVSASAAETEEGEHALSLNLVGDDLGMLIGRQNEVLSALEFITRLAVNQQTHSRSQFHVDVNGYRAKRAESLRKLALRTAEQVVQSGRTMVLEPMPPAERRIIHMTLRDHPQVTTVSIGEGDRRKVTVVPRKD